MEKELSVLCYSTEEMCAGIEKVNRMKEVIRKLVVISMDVEKLYPSLVASEVARVVGEISHLVRYNNFLHLFLKT